MPFDDQSDLTILAKTLYAEARGEPWVGQVAVACVIRNRTRDRRWPRSYAGVCLQKAQFSCWNGHAGLVLGTTDGDDLKERIAWDRATELARLIMLQVGGEDMVPDITDRANHYLNPGVLPKLPSWYDEEKVTLRPGGLVGKHVFLRL